jgi:GH24 family phage-related lysozyme (muramidase)
MNTSAIGRTPKPAKWGKTKTPLETMTKYEVKKVEKEEEKEKGYHSRLNSAVYHDKTECEEVAEDI